MIDHIQSRAVSYEEALGRMCKHLAAVFQEQEQWSEAANTLAKIDLESGMRVVDSEFKIDTYVKIAMLYLEDEDSVSAEMYIKKASSLLGACKSPVLECQYNTCYARILDSKRRFAEASMRYYDISQLEGQIEGLQVSEEDRRQALEAAVKCAILSAAGPQRSRLLATLYKDERTSTLPQFSILQKVYLERLLSQGEVSAFAETLASHQLALLPDGTTVLARSIMEHNLEACSKLYSTIRIDSLADLLGVSVIRALDIVARMITEGRLPAEIDQVDGIVTFLTASDASTASMTRESVEEICRRADLSIRLIQSSGMG